MGRGECFSEDLSYPWLRGFKGCPRMFTGTSPRGKCQHHLVPENIPSSPL